MTSGPVGPGFVVPLGWVPVLRVAVERGVAELVGRDGGLPSDALAALDAMRVALARAERALTAPAEVPREVPREVPMVDESGSVAVEWVTAERVAADAGVSASFVRRLARKGVFRGERRSNGWALDPVSVAEWMEGRGGSGSE